MNLMLPRTKDLLDGLRSDARGFQSGREDLNLRPLAPHASALAGLRHAPIEQGGIITTFPLSCKPIRGHFFSIFSVDTVISGVSPAPMSSDSHGRLMSRTVQYAKIGTSEHQCQ